MTSRTAAAMIRRSQDRAQDETARQNLAPTLTGMTLDDQTARELATAANKVRTWTEKRNNLIRAAYAGGAGVREIAKATGLNVGTVHTMLHGRKR